MLRFGTSSLLSIYLQVVSTAVTAVSPCVQGGRVGLSAVSKTQRLHSLPEMLRHWSTSCWAGTSNSCPVLVLQMEPTPSRVP